MQTESEAKPRAGDLAARISAALAAGDAGCARALAHGLHPADMATVIGLIEADQRVKLIELLGDQFKPASLSELDPQARPLWQAPLPIDASQAPSGRGGTYISGFDRDPIGRALTRSGCECGAGSQSTVELVGSS